MKRIFCPDCGRLAEYDPYYNRVYCTFCNYSSQHMSRFEFVRQVALGKFNGNTGVANGTRGSNKEV